MTMGVPVRRQLRHRRGRHLRLSGDLQGRANTRSSRVSSVSDFSRARIDATLKELARGARRREAPDRRMKYFRPRRSMLYSPANNLRFLEKAADAPHRLRGDGSRGDDRPRGEGSGAGERRQGAQGLRLRPARGDRARQPARLAVDRRRSPRGRAGRCARHPVPADREPAGGDRLHRRARPRRRRQPAGDDDDRDAVRRAALGGDRRRLRPHRLPGDGDRRPHEPPPRAPASGAAAADHQPLARDPRRARPRALGGRRHPVEPEGHAHVRVLVPPRPRHGARRQDARPPRPADLLQRGLSRRSPPRSRRRRR